MAMKHCTTLQFQISSDENTTYNANHSDDENTTYNANHKDDETNKLSIPFLNMLSI